MSGTAASPIGELGGYSRLAKKESSISSSCAVGNGANWNRADRNLYVVELDPKVFDKEERFAQANPHWIPGKLCVYVGITGLTPEERFQKHKSGHKAGRRFVQRYGRRLLPQFYEHINPLPYDLVQEMERELARQLRDDGLGVWQN